MPQDFTITIETGNDAMQTSADVADALREVADKLDAGRDGGLVRDANGNTVGRFDFDSTDPEEA